MNPLIVACVWVKGNRNYTARDVRRLSNMVKMWMPPDQPYEFICLTDDPAAMNARGISYIEVDSKALPGWWAKMQLFEASWRAGKQVLYFDLDTLIFGPLGPLLQDYGNPLAICANFTRALGKAPLWPCRYGSCIMSMSPALSDEIWDRFNDNPKHWKDYALNYGDQYVIEALYPHAHFLQLRLPKNYIIGYRELKQYPATPPKGCAIVVFAGNRTPANFRVQWAMDVWNVV